MNADEQETFVTALTRRHAEMGAALVKFHETWDHWAKQQRAALGAIVDKRTAGEQYINLVTVGQPSELQALGDLAADVVHHARVIYDRIERRKRDLDFGDDWPPKERAIWDAIRNIDNTDKHERSISIDIWIVEVTAVVTHIPDGLAIGMIPFNGEPLVMDAPTRAGATTFRGPLIPAKWRGPTYYYGITAAMEGRVGRELKGAGSGEEVSGLLIRVMAAATEAAAFAVKRVVGQS